MGLVVNLYDSKRTHRNVNYITSKTNKSAKCAVKGGPISSESSIILDQSIELVVDDKIRCNDVIVNDICIINPRIYTTAIKLPSLSFGGSGSTYSVNDLYKNDFRAYQAVLNMHLDTFGMYILYEYIG
jgi:hypothetical protein